MNTKSQGGWTSVSIGNARLVHASGNHASKLENRWPIGSSTRPLALLAAPAIQAQEVTGNIRGSVTDSSGARFQHAVVSAIKVETELARQVVSDSEGNYLLVLLPVGRYQLEAAATGFQKYVQDGIMLSVNEVAVVPVQLAVGSQQQTATVEADAALVETTNDLGETVHEQEILDLPLNGRNFSQLGLLQPGVPPLTQGLKDAGGPLLANQAYAVNGLRPESNEFLIDGVENCDEVYAGYAPSRPSTPSASSAFSPVRPRRDSATAPVRPPISSPVQAPTSYTAASMTFCGMTISMPETSLRSTLRR